MIDWRVDGKVKSIVKSDEVGTQVMFFYDGLGNRVAKKLSNKQLQGTSTTYYTRDAQGNTMGVYTHKRFGRGVVAPVLKEHHLYGSSRLGIQNYTDAGKDKDLGSFVRRVGDKSYELSNHLAH